MVINLWKKRSFPLKGLILGIFAAVLLWVLIIIILINFKESVGLLDVLGVFADVFHNRKLSFVIYIAIPFLLLGIIGYLLGIFLQEIKSKRKKLPIIGGKIGAMIAVALMTINLYLGTPLRRGIYLPILPIENSFIANVLFLIVGFFVGWIIGYFISYRKKNSKSRKKR